MDKKNVNSSIECSVKQCANHSCCSDHCALKSIKVGTHEKNPTLSKCVDCESFILGGKAEKTE